MNRWLARATLTLLGAVTLLFGATAVAAAQDQWPTPPPYPSATGPFDTKSFLTPADPDYWNPLVAANRLTSPFGTSTRIVCTGFHGVLLECWQADQAGNPHKLIRLPFNVPAIVGWGEPGGGPSHFVYPFWS